MPPRPAYRLRRLNQTALMGIRTPVTGVKSPCPRPLDDEGQRAPHYIQSYNFDKLPELATTIYVAPQAYRSPTSLFSAVDQTGAGSVESHYPPPARSPHKFPRISAQYRNSVMIRAGIGLRAVVFDWDRAMRVSKYAVLAVALLLTGCGFLSLGRPDLASDDPALKIPAMKLAARHHDQKAIPTLIKALSSQDSAIRFYAIYALRKITGHQFGFIYYASKTRRSVATARWKQWFTARRSAGFHLPEPKSGHTDPVSAIPGGAS